MILGAYALLYCVASIFMSPLKLPFPEIALLFVVMALGACVEPVDAAKARAAREYDCPLTQIRARWIGTSKLGEVYQVRACGVVATYACGDNEDCIRESDDRAR